MSHSVPTQPGIGQLDQVNRSDLPADGGDRYNRLIFEQSPYLLQHATNPIDWYPWGESAFAEARRLDCPVLLSIGYSTCHWCHVMAHESFEADDVGNLINGNYVAIKVDREERPDIDNAYMAVCQLMTGSGGWPLTLLLTPEKQPFFAATYLPKQTRGSHFGLIELLSKVRQIWQADRAKLLDSSDEIVASLKQLETARVEKTPPDETILQAALTQYREDFDPAHCGFGAAPKFPAPHNLEFLFRLARLDPSDRAAEMGLKTLKAIRTGGIYDQVGFGLHRYAVDERWLVPHFEKMLYDQALHVCASVSAWQLCGDTFHRQAALDTTGYVLRDLQHDEGGFYCGEDADSEGEEGTFYLWDLQELKNILPPGQAELAQIAFSLSEDGNFEGRNILQAPTGLEQLSNNAGLSVRALSNTLETIRQQLFVYREKRPRPHLDDKLLSGWNGLMIGALARAGVCFGQADLLLAANRAAELVLTRMRTKQGRLLRRYRKGHAAIPAFLEDYAFLCWGLLELFQAEFRPQRLTQAMELASEMLRLFASDDGLHDTGNDAETVLVRGRNLQDGAIPAGISVATELLLRLGRLTEAKEFSQAGENLLKLHLGQARRYPRAFAWFLSGLDLYLAEPEELLLVAGDDPQETAAMLHTARQGFHPNRLVCLLNDDNRELQQLIPWAADRRAINGATTAYYCRSRSCRQPLTEPAELAAQLQN